MVNIQFTQTWWEKDYLSIMPETLKALLEVNGTIKFKDPDTKKIISFTAREIANNPNLQWNGSEYIFPIN